MVQWLGPVMGAIGVILVAVIGYLGVIWRSSGRIRTTDAAKLWDEAGDLRDVYRSEIEGMREIIRDLRQQNAELRAEKTELKRKSDGPDVVGHVMPQPPAEPADRYTVAHSQRVASIANVVMLAIVLATVIVGGAVAYRWRTDDIEQRVRQNNRLTLAQQGLIKRQQQTINYLCQVTLLVDTGINQERVFWGLLLDKPGFKAFIGPNERDLLRERQATLDTLHSELTFQRTERVCRGI